MKRDEQTQAMIDDARFEQPGHYYPDQPLPDNESPSRPPIDLAISLVGPTAEAYDEFRQAARALEQHQKQMPALAERYHAALKRLSEAAAKD